jgi:hypothetical protein
VWFKTKTWGVDEDKNWLLIKCTWAVPKKIAMAFPEFEAPNVEFTIAEATPESVGRPAIATL